MKHEEYNKRLIKKLIETLKKRIPPEKESNYLDDIVNLLMDSLSKGEVYFDINKSYPHIELKEDGWPKLHLKELKESGWIDKEQSPIVIHNNQISWRRWFEEMQNLINQLSEKSLLKPKYNLNSKVENIDTILLKLNSQQKLAVDAVVNNNLILLSGGPGTGKTTTIVSMLVKAVSIKKNINIGLCAPTGKASRRLEETLKKSLSHLKSKYKQKLADIPCLTIHSWLQASDEGFIKSQDNQLQLDLLVVDEMSMVDFSLMQGLLNALNPESQLILVGDTNQLPPIGIGSIWHELHKSNHRLKFKHCSIHLNQIYRSKGELIYLSELIRSKKLNEFFDEVQNHHASENINIFFSNKELIPEQIIETIHIQQNKLKHLIMTLKTFVNPELILLDNSDAKNAAEDILTCLESLIVLCPRKYGYWSVEHINKTFLGKNFEEGLSKWPEGTPVICTRNQSNIKLANGDIGVIIEGINSKYLLFRVNSPGESGNCQLINPARIKLIEAAFAITIHKAQGSESEHVICFWPDHIANQNPTTEELEYEDDEYKKKLLYTAITRTKIKLDLAVAEKN